MDNHLVKLYDVTRQEVIAQLQEAHSVALTTDSWKSRATESYVTITCHYIDNKWAQREFTVQTRILEKKHSGENIAEILLESAEEWNIRDKVNALVTDNVSNMTVALPSSVRT